MGASDLRDQVNKAFVPFVRAAGFEQVSRASRMGVSFRRDAGAAVHVLEIQWEKYGRPRFVINYGTCPASGIDIAGKHFAPAAVLAGWLPDSGRLKPRRGGSVASWFRQDYPWFLTLLFPSKQRDATAVVAHAIELFAELETYWVSGVVGEHMDAVPPAPIANQDERD